MFSIIIYSTIESPIVKIARCTAEIELIINSLEKDTIFSVYDIDNKNVTMDFLSK